MTIEEELELQRIKNNSFRQTDVGKLFYDYVNKQAKAERYDAQMEYSDRGNYKILSDNWSNAEEAKRLLLNMLHQMTGII